MPTQSLTSILDAYHDKLDEHTVEIKDIQHDIETLTHSVSALEATISSKVESSGLRASLRDWIANVRELM